MDLSNALAYEREAVTSFASTTQYFLGSFTCSVAESVHCARSGTHRAPSPGPPNDHTRSIIARACPRVPALLYVHRCRLTLPVARRGAAARCRALRPHSLILA